MDGVPADAAPDDEDGITVSAIMDCRRAWMAEFARLTREVERARGRIEACDYMLVQVARVQAAARDA